MIDREKNICRSTLDRITIRELKARTFVGFNDWEQEKKQEVSITIALHADLTVACHSDKVEDTIDYKIIKNRVLTFVENNRFNLIEKMSEDIAKLCLENTQIEIVEVTVNKGSALRFADSVETNIIRYKKHV